VLGPGAKPRYSIVQVPDSPAFDGYGDGTGRGIGRRSGLGHGSGTHSKVVKNTALGTGTGSRTGSSLSPGVRPRGQEGNLQADGDDGLAALPRVSSIKGMGTARRHGTGTGTGTGTGNPVRTQSLHGLALVSAVAADFDSFAADGVMTP